MFSTMKMGLVAVAATAALGVAASSASATTVWTGVDSDPGTLVAQSAASTLHAPGFPPITCHVTLGDITLGSHGETSIDASTISIGGVVGDSPLCPQVTVDPNVSTWSDQICQAYDSDDPPPSGSAWLWDAIDTHLRFGPTPIPGELDVLLTAGGTWGSEPLVPDGVRLENNPIGSTGFSVEAEYGLDNPDGLSVTSNEDDCPIGAPSAPPASGFTPAP